MNIYIWQWLDQVSNNWHRDGGLVVAAKDDARARELIAGEEHVEVTEEEWQEVTVYEAVEGQIEGIFVFPDAGCC